MGYSGKLEEKRVALRLRRKGLSYSEIRKKVKVSKSTLSLWCRDVVLNVDQMEKLSSRVLEGAERGRIIGAKVQQRARINKTKQLNMQGVRDVGEMSKRDRFLAGIGLYIGDGVKGDKNVGFSNSNKQIIKFMMGWFREFCNVPEEKFRGAIWLHEGLDEGESRIFWSRLTGIPVDQFTKTYISKPKKESKKIRKNIHKYGVFAIRVCDVDMQRRVMGWMKAILR